MMRHLLPWLAAGSLLAGGPDGPSFTLFNDALFQHNELATLRGEGDIPRPGQFQDTLNLLGTWGSWSGGVALRSVNVFLQRPQSTLEDRQDRLHRVFLKYSDGGFSVLAGDQYALLGRGMVLSVVQNDKAMRERTLRGLDVRWQSGSLDARVLGGEVRSETGEQAWNVRGGEATWAFFETQRLGVRASRIEDTRGSLRLGGRDTRSVSLSGANLWDSLDYTTEVARLQFDKKGRKPGEASYSNLTFHRDGWLIQAEHKRYQNFDNELNNPPLADREDEVNELYDSEGHRLLIQRSFRDPSITVFASGGRYREGFHQGNQWYGGFTLEDLLNDRLSLTFQHGAKQLVYRIHKTDGSFTWRFDPRWSLQGSYRDKRYTAGSFRFLERDATLTLARAAWGSLFTTWQYAQQPVMGLNHLWSGGLRAELRKGSWLELSGGRLRGGEVCSGGQCAFLPPFKGWKLSSHWQF